MKPSKPLKRDDKLQTDHTSAEKRKPKVKKEKADDLKLPLSRKRFQSDFNRQELESDERKID